MGEGEGEERGVRREERGKGEGGEGEGGRVGEGEEGRDQILWEREKNKIQFFF